MRPRRRDRRRTPKSTMMLSSLDTSRSSSRTSSASEFRSPSPEAIIHTEFCMVCLNTSEDCRLYASNTYNLDKEFEYLTGISLEGPTHFEAQFCEECAQRLRKCSKFRYKSLTAYQRMMELVELDKPLTIQNIKSMCRSNNLTPSMSKKTFQPDYCDLNLIHEELQEQEKLQQELATNKVLQDLPNKELVHKQEDLLHIEPIKIEIKLFNGELILIPILEKENKVESKSLDVILNPIPEVENKDAPKSLDDSHCDFDINIDYIDDDNYSDIDTQCDKRTKNTVEKFINDTDNDCVVLKDSDCDNDSVSAIKTEIKIEKESISEPKLAPRKRKKVNKQMKKGTLECLEYFDVTTLTREEQLEDIQKRKEKPSYINGKFKCNICFKGFLNDFTYKAHMERHTDKYGTSVCPICGLHSRSELALRDHLTKSHRSRYSCRRCSFVTRNPGTAVNHAKWHAGTVYQCPHCPEVSISKTAWLSHIRIFHPTDVVCALCGFYFLSKHGLRKHVLMKHRLENVQNPSGPLCEACDVRFASEAAHQQHLKVSPKHAAGRKLVRNIPLPKGYKKRISKTTNEPITCEQCGLRLKNYRSYYHHFRIDHPEQARTQLPHAALLCELCGRAFGTRAHLQKHMRTHTGSRPYQCDTCSRAFYTEENLALHVQTHDASRHTHACPVCGRHFTNKPNRDRHVWTHKKRKPYPCDECDRTFADNSARREHVQHVHRRRPYPRRARGPPQRNSRPRDALLAVFGAARVEQPAPDVEMLED